MQKKKCIHLFYSLICVHFLITVGVIFKMPPPNTIVKDSIVIGGLSFLGYIAGGKLGSMLGKIDPFLKT